MPFAWEFKLRRQPKWTLCRWADPKPEDLQESRPTPNARVVEVRFVRVKRKKVKK